MDFGRQPKPVTVTISNGEDKDIEHWLREFIRYVESRGDNVEKTHSEHSFRIYPRAVND